MQAAALVAPRLIEIVEVAKPLVGPGEVLIAVRSVGVCGSDVHFYLDGHIGEAVAPYPYVLGHEFAGEVAEVGPGVLEPSVGSRVAVDPSIPCKTCPTCRAGNVHCCPKVLFPGSPPVQGALLEYYKHPAHLCVPLPDDVSYDQGALLEPLGVALHALRLAETQPGERIAILGAGPIGLLLLQLVLHNGAAAVYVSDPVAPRREMAEKLGATAVCNPTDADLESWIHEHTEGYGADVVFEAAWGGEAVGDAVRAARPKGRIILVGIPTDDVCSIPASAARRKELDLLFSRRMKATYAQAVELVSTGVVQLDPLITHRFDLCSTNLAFRMVAGLADGVIKAVVNI